MAPQLLLQQGELGVLTSRNWMTITHTGTRMRNGRIMRYLEGRCQCPKTWQRTTGFMDSTDCTHLNSMCPPVNGLNCQFQLKVQKEDGDWSLGLRPSKGVQASSQSANIPSRLSMGIVMAFGSLLEKLTSLAPHPLRAKQLGANRWLRCFAGRPGHEDANRVMAGGHR